MREGETEAAYLQRIACLLPIAQAVDTLQQILQSKISVSKEHVVSSGEEKP